jgi:aldehyde:ferredoxin oxidoreductase
MSVSNGKYLELDLNQQVWKGIPISKDEIKTWLLGSGLAAKIYYERMNTQIKPVDPENSLMIFNGVLTGSLTPTGCRSSWCGRSPLTRFWNESIMGNYWGAEKISDLHAVSYANSLCNRYGLDTISTSAVAAFAMEALGLCKFLVKGLVKLVEIVNSAFNWDWLPADAVTIGERIFQLERLINLRLDLTPADDVLPQRLITEHRPSGEAAGVTPDMELMLPIYYRFRDWDDQGRPSKKRIKALGLDVVQ